MTSRIEYSGVTHHDYTNWDDRAALLEAVEASVSEQVVKLSNSELLEEVLSLTEGDDWDGALTAGGVVALTALRAELSRRLKAVGFLENDYEF